MIPITVRTNFLDAHSTFWSKKLWRGIRGPAPVDVDHIIGVEYIVMQNEFNTIECNYRLGDRIYTQEEVKQLRKA